MQVMNLPTPSIIQRAMTIEKRWPKSEDFELNVR
jgi:hypothetical protein